MRHARTQFANGRGRRLSHWMLLLLLFVSVPVAAQDYSLQLAHIEATPGSTFSIPIEGEWSANVQGYTIGITFPNSAPLSNVMVDYVGTLTDELGPEFVDVDIDALQGQALFVVLLEAFPPIDVTNVLPPVGFPLAVGFVTGSVDANATAQTIPVDFANGLGDPPKDNIFVVANQSVQPTLSGGSITVVTSGTFIRGDVNVDGMVGLPDPLSLLTYLFLGGEAPGCDDAADATDDGSLQLNDALYILEFLFTGGAPMPAPFPSAGADPTDDTLGCINPLI